MADIQTDFNVNAEPEKPGPMLTLQDIQRGEKPFSVIFKNGEVFDLIVKAISTADLGAIHLDNDKNDFAIEQAIFAKCLPDLNIPGESEPVSHTRWMEWLDMESRHDLIRLVREFAYGFKSEQKRTELLGRLFRLVKRGVSKGERLSHGE